MNLKPLFAVPVLSLFIFNSCTDTDSKGKPLDTVTSGEIKIAVDETFQPIIEAELEIFHTDYKRAKISPLYTSEINAFDLLLKDSVRAIVSARDLSESEKNYFKKIPLTVRPVKIAYDALTFVVNRENKDTLQTFSNIKAILEGKLTSWQDLDPKSKLKNITIVFDNQGSSSVRFLKDKLKLKELPANCFAAKTNKEVIDYVEKNPASLGIIGVNWISDGNDPSAKHFLKQIKTLAIKAPDTAQFGNDDFYKPYQAYIATHQYYFWRRLYIIMRESRSGLGTGFASFAASDKGQLIILKAGLVPATAPVRLVQTKKTL